MANQSAKKNQIAIRGKIKFLNFVLYPITLWLLITNAYFLYHQTITYWHFLFCLLVAITTHICIKQTVKCWEFQLPEEASQYYIDILALNTLVSLIDPFTHLIWHMYWFILLFFLSLLGKWLWHKIDPKYEQQEEVDGKKKQKKEKKQKIKYIKK